MYSEKSKYQRWYDDLVHSRKLRAIPIAYTEVHHILPRALGGGDGDTNLVRLTYREHFLAHWLLTKCLSGKSLRKMQFALHAMTLPSKGARIIAGWQYEVAKRALVTEEMIERTEARARAEHIKRNHSAVIEAQSVKLKKAMESLGLNIPSSPPWSPVVRQQVDIPEPQRRKRRRRRPRAGKRVRTKQQAAQLAS